MDECVRLGSLGPLSKSKRSTCHNLTSLVPSAALSRLPQERDEEYLILRSILKGISWDQLVLALGRAASKKRSRLLVLGKNR